jgi:hypothetical protein
MGESTEAVAWLRQQIEGDKERAEAAGGGAWHTGCRCDGDCRDYPDCDRVEGDDITIYNEGGHNSSQAVHIALHDPQDVIADAEATLTILDELTLLCLVGAAYPDEAGPESAAKMLRSLASAYRYRDGYAEHWGEPATR